jgi:hypothetical protein
MSGKADVSKEGSRVEASAAFLCWSALLQIIFYEAT